MSQMDNDLNALSVAISKIEIALHDYVLFPKAGLEKLKASMVSLQGIAILKIKNTYFLEQLSFYIKAVDVLLSTGAVYSNKQHSSLLSCADALIQFAISFQFDVERSRQSSHLLSLNRECWKDLSYIMEEPLSPNYIHYEGRWDTLLDYTVKSDLVVHYLSELSRVGVVSFHYDSIDSSFINGRFLLQSTQSLSWLQQRFSNIHWTVIHEQEIEESIKNLCELIYLPTFQNDGMSRQSKYQLLDIIKHQSKAYLYKKFETIFPYHFDFNNVYEPSRLVPCFYPVSIHEVSDHYFPIRVGGVFYLGTSDIDEESIRLTSLSYLGRDYLSSFLYEVKTKWGQFVFDRFECIGTYSFSRESANFVNKKALLEVAPNVLAKFIDNISVFLIDKEPSCSLLEESNVLVVRQAGECFAIPYISIQEVECVCSVNGSFDRQVKNIWQDSDQSYYLEPWLVSYFNLTGSSLFSVQHNQTSLGKSGYYQGEIGGVVVWIEAALVIEILPYKKSSYFVSYDFDHLYIHPFITHEGVNFDSVIPCVTLDELSDVIENNKFTVILTMSQKSLVLQLVSCEWVASLPEDIDCLDGLDLLLERGLYKNQISKLASLQGKEVIINRENYLSYVNHIN